MHAVHPANFFLLNLFARIIFISDHRLLKVWIMNFMFEYIHYLKFFITLGNVLLIQKGFYYST
jgi:hypothetical protein